MDGAEGKQEKEGKLAPQRMMGIEKIDLKKDFDRKESSKKWVYGKV